MWSKKKFKYLYTNFGRKLASKVFKKYTAKEGIK